MNGLELAKSYYEEFGAPMLREQFPELIGKIAVGLVGSGSECFGFDDEISRDHDFEPGFCIFLPGEDVIDRRTAFLLERAYSKLPRDYAGLRRGLVQPVGGARRGVLRTADFYTEKVGEPEGRLSLRAWLTLPEQSLAEATNGEVFADPSGAFSAIRERLSALPESVRRKKLAGSLLGMAQAGQYNYSRCLAHGETGAAQLAMAEFVRNALHAVFLLNRRYLPYYKWQFRALRGLAILPELADTLEFLLASENDPKTAETKADIVEDVARMTIGALQDQELTDAICGDLEKHAYSVNDKIAENEVRHLPVTF